MAEMKNICGKIPVELHEKVRAEIEEKETSTQIFIQQVIEEHFNRLEGKGEEWRCFESTLHAGKVRANITLALAISAQAINQKCTQMRKTEITENPAFTFRTFLLRLGLIGPEYKNVREHLLANLEGDRAWRYDRSTYECLNRNHRAEDAR